jgi:hypothetical protein
MEIIITLSLIAGLCCLASVAPRLALGIILAPGILFLLVCVRFLFD